MKKLLLFSLPIIMLFSCSDDLVYDQHDSVTEIFSEIHISNNTGLYVDHRGNPVDGHFISTFENGNTRADFLFEDGLILEGQILNEQGNLIMDYMHQDGYTINTGYFENELPSIRFVISNENQQVAESYVWNKDGTPNLAITREYARTWYENGQLKSEAKLKNGKMQGKVIAWHENGVIAAENHFTDDEMDGTFTEWDENGERVRVRTYEMGTLISEDK